jgi:hypothetical protein
MAELTEDEDRPLDHGQRVIGADPGANTAMIAEALIDLRDEDRDLLARLDPGLQEKLGVGLLDVAVQELDGPGIAEGQGQADRDGRLARAAFARGDGDGQSRRHVSCRPP